MMDVTGTLNPEIKKILEGACLHDGWGTTDKELAEFLQESEALFILKLAAHRWYDEKTVVVKVDGWLIQFDDYHLTGDNSKSDMGLEFDLSSVKFCEAYQVTVTKYRPKM